MAFTAQHMDIELLIFFFHFFHQQTAQLFPFPFSVYKHRLLRLPPACLPQHSPCHCDICISSSPGSISEHLIGDFGALTYESTLWFTLGCLHAPFSLGNAHSHPAHLSAPAWFLLAVIYREHVPKGNISEGQMGSAFAAFQDKPWLMQLFHMLSLLRACICAHTYIGVNKGTGLGADVRPGNWTRNMSFPETELLGREVCALVTGFLYQNRFKELQGPRTVIRWQFCR